MIGRSLRGWGDAMRVTEKLRSLRLRAGISQARMGKLLGLAGQSSYRHYEDPNLFRREAIPPEIVAKLAQILIGKAKNGQLPIAREEVWQLAGTLISRQISESEKEENLPLLPSSAKRMPVLRWDQIMAWLTENIVPSEIREYTDPSHEQPGIKSFLVPVINDCLSGDQILPGDKVVCDPDKPLEPGRIVIAEIHGESQPVIGHYHVRKRHNGERFIEIVPSNPAWETHVIDSEHPGKIVGRVVEVRKAI